MSGVYAIVNTDTNMAYVGSTYDFEKRKNEHFRALRSGYHYNKKMQRSFDKYGEDKFVFEQLQDAESAELLEAEQYWINLVGSANRHRGFNLNPVVNNGQALTHTDETKRKISRALKGRLISEETRSKISVALTGKPGPSQEIRDRFSEMYTGRELSKETRSRMSESRKYKGKLVNAEIASVIKLLLQEGLRIIDIADIFGVTNPTVQNIKDNKGWNYVEVAKQIPQDIMPLVAKARDFKHTRTGGKLTGAQVLEIRELVSRGGKNRDIAKAMGVSPTTVSHIRTGKAWRHV